VVLKLRKRGKKKKIRVNEFFFGVVVEEEMKNCRKNAVLA
jgi:hypothetical protein